MTPTEPLPLHHSWPLCDLARRFDLGQDHGNWPDTFARTPGSWTCNLADNSLIWSPMVYQLFGFPEDCRPTRADSLALYDEASRAAMERLRSHAIKHRRGFTLDIKVAPIGGGLRWLRLMAAADGTDKSVTRLRGYKRDVTELYTKRS